MLNTTINFISTKYGYLTKYMVAVILILTTSYILAQDVANQATKETPSGIRYLEYLPQNYINSGETYPVIIFLHGLGEKGSDITKVAKHGPPKHIKNGNKMTYEVEGKSFNFIVISPQLKGNYGAWNNNYLGEVITHVKNSYRIDKNRLYLTGLSLGGGGTWNYAREFPEEFTAIAPVCGTTSGYSKANACNIGNTNLPVWAFHGENDNVVSPNASKNWVNSINACNPTPPAILTLYPGIAHNAWDRAYQPDHQFHNPNVYEWLLSYNKNKVYVNAGKNRTIEQPKDSVHIAGKISVPEPGSETYSWEQVEGPSSATLSGTSTATLIAGSLEEGIYKFKLTITANSITESDEIQITVLRPNVSPIANAGPDRVIELPKDSVIISGQQSFDPDGSISNYLWKQLAEPSSGFKVLVNFSNNTETLGGPWNNTLSGFRNKTLSNLIADNGATTTINIEMFEGWWDVNDLGVSTGNDSGLYPDKVIKTNYWFKDNPVKLRVANLEPSKLYNFTFFGSRGGVTDNRTTTYTINGTTVNLNAAGNKDNSVSINGVSPNASGEIIITIFKPAASAFAYLAAMEIETSVSSIKGVTESILSLSELVEGEYEFELEVTDNLGKSDKDTVSIIVSSDANQVPAAKAGDDITITAPVSQITLDGSNSSDPDGSIASYKWSKKSGPESFFIDDPNKVKPLVTGLVPGEYIFELEVTDNEGRKNADEVIINVLHQTEECGCDIVLDNSKGAIYLDGSTLNIQPGDVICLKAGHYDYINMWNFNGSEKKPITIKNCGGQVTIGGESFHYGFVFNGKYFRLTGTGDQAHEYGINIKGSTNKSSVNLAIGFPSSHFEVDHIESGNAGFAGIMVKRDPRCDQPEAWRRNYEMQNVKIHDCYVHNSGGEGFYVGFTGGAKDCGKDRAYAHLIKNIYIYNNIIENSGWDGIQLVKAYGDVKIYNNHIFNFGIAEEKWQQTGLQVGLTYLDEGSQGKSQIYNNLIENGTGPGTLVLGTSATFFNNIYKNVASSSIHVNDAIYIASGSTTHPNGYNFINNMVFAHPNARSTIRVTNQIGKSNVINNISNGKIIGGDVVQNNIVISNLSNLQEKTEDKGINTSLYGVNFDFNNVSRPQGGAYDIGPYEYEQKKNDLPVVIIEKEVRVTLPAESVAIDGSGSYDPDGNIVSFLWEQESGPSKLTLNDPDSSLLVIRDLKAGIYGLSLTVVDDSAATDTKSITLVVDTMQSIEPNMPPVALIARKEVRITLPAESVAIDGSGSYDPDGNIVSFLWEQESGPSKLTLVGSTENILQIENLQLGYFEFILTVTDDSSSTATDTIAVIVDNPITPPSPRIVLASDGEYTDRVVITWQNEVFDGKRLYYKVYRSISNDTTTAQGISGWVLDANSFTDSNIALNKEYFYFVRASTSDSGEIKSMFSEGDIGYVKSETLIRLFKVNKEILEFGDVLYGDSISTSFVIANVGEHTLTVDSIVVQSPFYINWDSGEILAGEQQTIEVNFMPTDTSSYFKNLVIFSDANPKQKIIGLSGKGYEIYTGIESPEEYFNVSIYPNPFINSFFLYFDNDYYGDIEIAICNSLGELDIIHTLNKKNQTFSVPIELKTSSEGIYLLSIRFGKEKKNIFTKKLLKHK